MYLRFLLLGLAVSSLSMARPMTDAEYHRELEAWHNTNLSFSFARNTILNTPCYTSLKQFRACWSAINNFTLALKPPLQFVPKSRANPKSALFTSGPLVLIAKSNNGPSLRERATAWRNEMARSRSDTSELFSSQSNPVDFATILSSLEEKYVTRENEAYLSATLINGFQREFYDVYTYILPTSVKDEMLSSSFQHNETLGLGFDLVPAGNQLRVNHLIDGKPAALAGIRLNDIITHVNGEDISLFSEERRLNFCDFKKATPVIVTVRRGNQILEFSATPEVITKENVVAVMRTSTTGYIGLSFFSTESCEEVENAINLLKKKGAKNWILDLRNNPGGRVDVGVCIANLFLDRNLMISKQKSDSEPYNVTDFKARKAPLTTAPLVVLTNSFTISASEFVAGAFQDHQRGWVVGNKTYGKSVVQSVIKFDFPGISQIITTARYFLPKMSWNESFDGIDPDFLAYLHEDPEDEDVYCFRASDFVLTPSKLPVYHPKRSVSPSLDQCVRTGKARQRFDAHESFDYQALVADDVLNCL